MLLNLWWDRCCLGRRLFLKESTGFRMRSRNFFSLILSAADIFIPHRFLLVVATFGVKLSCFISCFSALFQLYFVTLGQISLSWIFLWFCFLVLSILEFWIWIRIYCLFFMSLFVSSLSFMICISSVLALVLYLSDVVSVPVQYLSPGSVSQSRFSFSVSVQFRVYLVFVSHPPL